MNKILVSTAMAILLLGTTSASVFDPCCDCLDGEFTASIDYLLWNARRCDLDFAVPVGTGASIVGRSEVESLHPGYDSGVRLGLGYTFCSGLNLTARYTYFQDSASRTLVANDQDLYATRLQVAEGLFLRAESHYDLDYNVLDLELGSLSKVDCNSSYRYFMGAKFAFLKEEMKTVYSTTSDPTVPVSIEARETLDLDAYGLTGGMEFTQDVWCNFGLYGRGSLGLLVGNYDKKHVERNVVGNVAINNISSCDHCFLGTAELAAGVYYDFCDFSCVDLRLGVGYEFQGWINTQDFIHFSLNSPERVNLTRSLGNFGLDGLFVRLEGRF